MARKEHPEPHAPTSGKGPSKDFRRLRESGETAGVSRAIGGAFVASRDALARVLIRLGITPNHLTLLGFLMTVGAAYCLARGASSQLPYFYSGVGPKGWWPLGAAVFLTLAGACDMLDGAVARIGKLSTRFGAMLDSSLDRFSDMAVYLGCALHFAWQGNITYQLLAILALCGAVLISYIKARAEAEIDDCSVGYWLRGERCAALLISCLSGHVPAMLWQQALSPMFTVWRRLTYTRSALAALEAGRPVPPTGPDAGWRGLLRPWRYARGSIPYDVVTGLNIAYLVFAARIWSELLAFGDWADPLSRLLGR